MIEMNTNMRNNDGSKPAHHLRLPAGITKGQVVRAVTDFIALDPNVKQYSASVVVWMALSRAYPCGNPK
jgi:Rap1a immunity proteins